MDLITNTRLIEKRLPRLSKAEKLKFLHEIEDLENVIRERTEIVKNADPFWFYNPSTGKISDDRFEFLSKHIDPDDIPPKLPGQMDVHLSKSPIRGASGGNQAGKTVIGAIEAFIKATGELPIALNDVYPKEKLPKRFPQHVRVIGKDWENGVLLNVLPTYQKWVPRQYLKNGRWEDSYSSEKATLYLAKHGELKGTIEFMSNAQTTTSFQGPPRDMIVYDEEPRQDVYKENLFRFTTRDTLDVLFCMTPTEGMTWIYDLVQRNEDDAGNRVEWFKIPSVCNPLSNLRILEEIVKDLSYEEKKMRLLGEFISISGLVYGNLFNQSIHMIDPFQVACNCGGLNLHDDQCPYKRFVVYRGIDPHLVTPTAVVWVAVDRNEMAYVVDSWFEESDIELVKRIVFEKSKGMRCGWSVVDSAADSDIEAFGGLNIFKKLTTGQYRIPRLRLATKGQGSIKTGVDEVKQYLRLHDITKRPRLFIMNTENNRVLMNSFRTMEKDRYINEDRRGKKDRIMENKHHLHAALRYVFMQQLNWRSDEFQSVNTEPTFENEEIFT